MEGLEPFQAVGRADVFGAIVAAFVQVLLLSPSTYSVQDSCNPEPEKSKLMGIGAASAAVQKQQQAPQTRQRDRQLGKADAAAVPAAEVPPCC